MLAYRQFATVQKSKQITLTNLPFQPGQRVEVVVIAENEEPAGQVRELRELFAITQALPQAQAMSEAEIAAEVAAYRAGQ